MQLSVNTVDFLMLALVLQGFILSVLLFYSSKTIISNRWLSALIFIVSESTLMMELDYSGTWQKHLALWVYMPQLTLAIGPLIYFYTQSLIFTRDKLNLKGWLHFAPVLIGMKYQVIYLLYITGLLSVPFIQNFYFLPWVQQALFGNFPSTTIIAFVSVTVYAVFIYITILKYEKSASLPVGKLKELKRIKNLLYFMFMLVTIWLISIVVNMAFAKSLWHSLDHYILYIPAISFVYFLGMTAYRRQNNMPAAEIAEYKQKPTKVYFAALEADQYIKQLAQLMAVQQLFLNPLLKVDDVAANLQIPEKALSNLINHSLGKNFNDFINEYRVNEARKRLTDPVYQNFTIAAIAFDCGFNSLPTFQRVFKQFTGITPSSYQNNVFLPQLSVK